MDPNLITWMRNKLKRHDTDLADMAQYLGTPVATYTHTVNKEVIVSAVDVNTDTFTSVGHGLSNGNRLCPIINNDGGLIYPNNVYPGGIPTKLYPGYYVVNKTTDTFQLSLTNGGAAIDLTANANLDLTKWHFERMDVLDVSISSLPSLTKLKLRVTGKCFCGYCYLLVNNIVYGAEYIAATGAVSYDNPRLNLKGDVSLHCDIMIDYTNFLKYIAKGYSVVGTSATTNTMALIDQAIVTPKYKAGTITGVLIGGIIPANGLKVEVYRV